MWIDTDDGDLINLSQAAGIDFREHHGPQERASSYAILADMPAGAKVIRTFRVDPKADAKQVEADARAFMGAIREALKAKDSLVHWDKPRTTRAY